jgi:hypothetical protein
VTHSIEELLAIIYRYYPRGVTREKPEFPKTPEYLALKAASRAAGQERHRWLAMLDRLRARFPDCEIEGHALHLLAGGPAACYPATLCFPESPNEPLHRIGFQVSFLAPYYVLYSQRCTDKSSDVRLHPDEQERPYWEAIAEEIEKTHRAEPMPMEIGYVSVPGIQPDNCLPCEAMIYDCFFETCPRLIEQDEAERRKREDLAFAVASGHWAIERIHERVVTTDVIELLDALEPALIEFMARRDAGKVAGGPQGITAADIDRLRRLRELVHGGACENEEITQMAKSLMRIIGGESFAYSNPIWTTASAASFPPREPDESAQDATVTFLVPSRSVS